MAEDPFGSLLRIRSSMPSSRGGVLPKRGCSLQLQLELSWPLTAFLPPVGCLVRLLCVLMAIQIDGAECHSSAR